MTTPHLSPVPDAPPKRDNPFGLAALILGVLAVAFAVFPFFTFLAPLPGLAAVALGITGLVSANRTRVTAIFGVGLGVLGIVLGVIYSIGTIAVLADFFSGTSGDPDGVSLVYEVSSDAQTAANVTYMTFDRNDSGRKPVLDAEMPWSWSEEVLMNEYYPSNTYTLTAEASDESSTITCRITLDGQIIAENTASGPGAVASCTGTTSDLD